MFFRCASVLLLLPFVLRPSLNPLQRAWDRAERNEAVRDRLFRSYVIKHCLGSCKILGLASRISSNVTLCTCHDISTLLLLCANWCPRLSSVVPICTQQNVICSHSVGPFLPKEEKGCNTSFSSNIQDIRTVYLGLR